jgi:hypothetical protein
MKTIHVNNEELVEMYYGEAAPGKYQSAKSHMEDCAECAEAFRSMEIDMKALGTIEAPERDEDYGERMWQRVAGALPAAAGKPARRRRPWLWLGLSYAAGCAVLVSSAFYVGTVWEHQQHLKRAAARAALQPHAPAQQPKIVVVVLGDYLDRSERLLVELKHADVENSELVKPLPEEAKGLLAANHVFQQDAEKQGDEALSHTLDDLDHLLTQLAEQPGGLNAASLERLQQEMTNEGLLFEVRVLRSKNPHRQTAVRVTANGGTA